VQSSRCEVGIHILADQRYDVRQVCEENFRSQQSKGHSSKPRAGAKLACTLALDICSRKLPFAGILKAETHISANSNTIAALLVTILAFCIHQHIGWWS
jgi:hypothetical protein